MKKYIAFLLCLIMLSSLFSCNVDKENYTDSSTGDTTDKEQNSTQSSDDTTTDNNAATDNNTTTNNNTPVDEPIFKKSEEHYIAMRAYAAVIKGEGRAIDERLGEINLKGYHFPSNNTRLKECRLLEKAVLDVDGDGIGEFVIKSPDQEYIILRYYNGKVYSYCLESCDFYKFNTDGTFYWAISPDTSASECGLSKIVFEGESLSIKSLYSLKGTELCEYFVEGEAVTEREYYNYRKDIRKKTMNFSYFDLTPLYPINSEQAWNLANEYWNNQDGSRDAGAGSFWINNIVLIEAPSSDTDHYRVSIQTESYSSDTSYGNECMPPYFVKEIDQILINAFTGEIITPEEIAANGKCISLDEAIEIAKNNCNYVDFDKEGSNYRVELDVNRAAPDHVYNIVVQKLMDDHYFIYSHTWIDKYTGEIISPYYMYGKG
jgi:hypothetical protein